jgi:hypothetical protein
MKVPSFLKLSLSTSVFLLGCGGGSGSEPQAPATPTAVLNPQNAEAALRLGFGLSEIVLTLANEAQKEARVARAAGGTSGSIACPVAGSIGWSLQDRDGTATMTPGDIWRREYRGCVTGAAGARNGEVIELLLDQVPGAQDVVAGVMTLVSGYTSAVPGGQLTLSGSVRFEHLDASRSQKLVVLPTGSGITLTGTVSAAPIREQATALSLSRHVNAREGLIGQDISFSHDSGALGGTLDVRTTATLQSDLHAYPHAGRLVITGASESSVTSEAIIAVEDQREKLRPMIVIRSANSALTTQTSNWNNFTSDDFWWAEGVVPREGNPPAVASERQFRVLHASQRGHPQRPQSQWIFSRPIDSSKVGALRFVRNPAEFPNPGWGYQDADWAAEQIEAEVVVDGTLLSIAPKGLLQLGRYYPIDPVTGSGGTAPPRVMDFFDSAGRRESLAHVVVVPETLRARIGFAPPPSLPSSSPALHLNATDSSAPCCEAKPIVSYRWTQVSGPPLNFSMPTAAQTLATPVGPYPEEDSIAVIDLEITNSDGDIDRDRRSVLLPKRVADAPTIFFRSNPGSFVGGGEARRQILNQTATGSLIGTPFYFVAEIAAKDPLPGSFSSPPSVQVSFAVDQRAAISAPASYSASATAGAGVSISVNSSICSDSDDWKVDVLEYTYVDNSILTLAADFELNTTCGRIYGSVRVNSPQPIRP